MPHAEATPKTLRSVAREKLRALSSAMELPHGISRAPDLVETMLGPWADHPLGAEPGWKNDLTDDGTPFEFSVTFASYRRQLRLLVEPQQAEYSADSTWNAGLSLNSRLAARGVADLTWFEKIQQLFAPVGLAPARFLLWHGVVIAEDERDTIKVYVNPQVLGLQAARPLVLQALSRLGLNHAVEFMETTVASNTPILYFSLDLLPAHLARVKVYTAHPQRELEAVADTVTRGTLTPSQVARGHLLNLTGGSATRERPILSCYAFRQRQREPELTLHVPVRCFSENDAQSLERACGLLQPPDQARLRKAVATLATVPPRQSRGLISYVAVRDATPLPNVTVYFAPQAYSSQTTRPPSAQPTAPQSSLPPRFSHVRELSSGAQGQRRATFADVQACIDRQQAVFRAHPFYERLDETTDLYHAQLVASRIAFFVMVFQDVLRLAHAGTKDPVLRKISETHRQEDAGHDQWFLSDLRLLGLDCDAEWLFSRHHEVTRDVAYDQVACLLSVTSDHARLAVALSLESIGAIFFEKMIGFLERAGFSEGLQYFARSHQQVEQDHDVFEASSRAKLERIEVPYELLPEVWEVVDRTFAGMSKINDDLQKLFRQPRESIVVPRAAAGDPLSTSAGSG